MKLKRLGVILAACSLLLQVPVFAGEVQGGFSNKVGVYVYGGLKVEYENPCFIKNGVVYVPLRETAVNNGFRVQYNKPNIEIVSDLRTIEMNPNKKVITISGTELPLVYMPEIVNGVTYIAISDSNNIDSEFHQIENEMSTNGEYRVLMRTSERTEQQKANIANDYSFDLELLKHFPQNKNSVVSPISLKTALAMTANGATGETQKQILNALKINDLNAFNEKIKNIDEKQYETAKWTSANSIWANEELLPKGITWNKDFTNILTDNYNGISDSIKGSSDISKMNNWISDNTNGLIKDAIKQTDFDLMLMNASYFKGKWSNEFDEIDTKPNTFFNKNGTQTTTDFMRQTKANYFYEEKGLKALTMEYGNGGYEKTSYDMTFIMTDKDLDSETLNRIFNYQDEVEVQVRLPKFKIKNEADCIAVLKEMGIDDLFDKEKADLSSMVNDTGYYVNQIVQNAVISIDEKGTEAAAETQSSILQGDRIKTPPEFIADHPFYFFLRNNQTGDILFEGYFSSAE